MVWCTTDRSVGRASAICTHLSSVKPVGRNTYWYSTIPDAGTANVCGNSKITSGFAIPHPSTKFAAGGISFESPCGAPALTHATKVLISFALNERSLAKCPYPGSANQGGIIFCCTTRLMLVAQGRASSYVSSEKGAASPGRWHIWHFF